MELTSNEALSGVTGSISLASSIFLLIPQLYENYSSQSGDGVSILFLLIWAAGDIFNLSGAILAGLVPTIIALAVYFTFSDSVLILQCLYYRFWAGKSTSIGSEDVTQESTSADGPQGADGVPEQDEDEEQPLLDRQDSHRSYSSIGLPGSHKPRRSNEGVTYTDADGRKVNAAPVTSTLRTSLINTGCVLGVCLVGTLGWFICYKAGIWVPVPPPNSDFNDNGDNTPWAAELLGYLSAVLYLGARIPQIIKNHRDKSCEGLSLLFFLLSVLGNLTYGASILAHSLDKQYVLTNVPWLLGSLGTLVEDATIFVQFHLYRDNHS